MRFLWTLTYRALLLAPFFLAACSAPVNAVTDYVKFNRQGARSRIAETKLDPAYKYLLVTLKGTSFLMALGGVEASPQGPVQIWYTGSREVLRMRNGQVIGLAGAPVEWLDVRLSAEPDWTNRSSSQVINRERDVMPNYEFGLQDRITLQPTETPWRNGYYGKVPAGVQWFREDSNGPAALPSVRYAVQMQDGQAQVIYGEQCLSKSICFSWQRWPNPS